ncbi:MAG: hypothetical protein ACXAC5_02525 [Promethearchaeota archaeon]|jgi:hypothetical protein
MNWLQKIAQKPMALPVAPPAGQRNELRGIDRIDEQMTPETAQEEYTPEMEWGGAGAFGVVYKTGPGEMTKYTKDYREFETAKIAYEQDIDWVVPILEEPTQLQYDPPLYRIRMKRMQPMGRHQASLVEILIYSEGKHGKFPDIENIMESYVPILDVDEILYLYKRIEYILEQNRKSLWLTDIHSGNIGWDGSHLKVWDIGPGTSPQW